MKLDTLIMGCIQRNAFNAILNALRALDLKLLIVLIAIFLGFFFIVNVFFLFWGILVKHVWKQKAEKAALLVIQVNIEY